MVSAVTNLLLVSVSENKRAFTVLCIKMAQVAKDLGALGALWRDLSAGPQHPVLDK